MMKFLARHVRRGELDRYVFLNESTGERVEVLVEDYWPNGQVREIRCEEIRAGDKFRRREFPSQKKKDGSKPTTLTAIADPERIVKGPLRVRIHYYYTKMYRGKFPRSIDRDSRFYPNERLILVHKATKKEG